MSAGPTFERLEPSLYRVWDGSCVLGAVRKDGPKKWMAVPADQTAWLERTFKTRGAAATALIR